MRPYAQLIVLGTWLYFLLITATKAQVLFYAGDYDGRIGVPSQWTPDYQDLTFEGFGLSQNSNLQSIWGNFGLAQTVDDFVPTEAYCEIRSGISAGNGGTLLFSGTLPVQATPTGIYQWGEPEYQVLADIDLTLPAGIYWLGMAPVGDSDWDEANISSTSGGDAAPASDPNPPTTGFPIAEGMSYFYDPVGYNYVPLQNTTAGPGIWDFSYGVSGVVVVPEPSSELIFVISTLLTVCIRRSQAKNVKVPPRPLNEFCNRESKPC
jgi:hypothetical protein